MWHLSRSSRFVVHAAVVIASSAAYGACTSDSPRSAKAESTKAAKIKDGDVAPEVRDEALAAARVWNPPAVPIGKANLRDNPVAPGSFHADQEVSCQFKLQKIGGLTPKFYCQLPDGDVVKVKYGGGNAEVFAEVAATRLLTALGFGADRMYVVKRVRCAGCPSFPFQALKCYQETGIKAACFPGGLDEKHIVDFHTAVIERRLEGREIESVPDQGWAWYELEKIDPSRGGSARAEVDALRLMAVLLAHWDNKAENQRLLCRPGADRTDGGCDRPLAILQDVGATFGPAKVDLNNWRKYEVWADAPSCKVSMASLPYSGATFKEWHVSDAGRTLLLSWLEQLTDQQLRDLFEGSHITSYDQVTAASRGADAWVNAFKEKVTQIRKGGPCPKVTPS